MLGAADAGAWAPLISSSWSLEPGATDVYRCARRTVHQDLYVRGFRALSPPGTHHTVLSLDRSGGADGEFACRAASLAPAMLFASGVGTDDFLLPEGLAFRIPAGSQLLVNLHLFNASDLPLSGTSGTEVLTVAPGSFEAEVELILAGSLNFTIPAIPAGQSPEPYTVTGRCRFARDQTVVAVWPHMHQIGIHMKVTHEASGAVWTDAPYAFERQVHHPIAPTLVRAEEAVRVDCTYLNDTGMPVDFGDSSEKEMCFAGLYRYPAYGQAAFCASSP